MTAPASLDVDPVGDGTWPSVCCPACGGHRVIIPDCTCGHAWGQHNIEQRAMPCSVQHGPDGRPCPCQRFQEAP